MKEAELLDIISDLGEKLHEARDALAKCKEELDWYQKKLIEAQERNRKLDWVLTKTTEELR